MTDPLVSLVIPTCDGARYLSETLTSVFSQTLDDLEIIVSDDGSRDATREVVSAFQDPRLRMFSNPNPRQGAHANWNYGLGQARGRYLKLLCQDDLLHPRCLQVQVEAMSADSSVALCAVQRRLVTSRGRVLAPRWGLAGLAGRVDRAQVLRACSARSTNVLGEPSAILMRTDLARRIGGFRALRYVVDLDMWSRLLRHGNASIVRAPLTDFRVHARSWSSELRREQARETTEYLLGPLANGDPLARGRRIRVAVRAGALQSARRLLYALSER
ncbi:MAG: glycosyltransferase family 2 protein [Mycobacteriales bacterium]